MTEKPLLSLAILAYKNYHYIKEALNSVFMQDYPNIQLIISNDGSDDFEEEDLISYLNASRTKNITQIIINNNERNVGTVKNINIALSKAKGAYLMLMAADDALYDERTLSRFVDEFERLGPDAYIISAKTAMCGAKLSDIKSYEPNAEGIEAIKNFNSQQMFSRLSHTFTIPTTSTCYRMSLFEEMGVYDEDYFIIEDAPLYIKMARLGYRFHWINDMVAARHRDGGISHGNTNNTSEGYRIYRYDEINIYKNEILPYKELILPNDYKLMLNKWNYLENSYFQTFIYPNMSKSERRQYNLKNWPKLIRNIFKRAKDKLIEFSFDEYFMKDVKRITFLSAIIYFVMLFHLFRAILGDRAEYIILYISGYASLISCILIFLLYLMRIIYRTYIAVKYAFTGR